MQGVSEGALTSLIIKSAFIIVSAIGKIKAIPHCFKFFFSIICILFIFTLLHQRLFALTLLCIAAFGEMCYYRNNYEESGGIIGGNS